MKTKPRIQTIHAGTTPDDDKIVVRTITITDAPGGVAGSHCGPAPTRVATEIEIPARKALALAAELIHAANVVLEREQEGA